jgi:hypothetical protein
MWFRRVTGVTLGLLILGLGLFLSFEELRGPEPPRWWLPGFAVIPGALILGITWLTWSIPRRQGSNQSSGRSRH